MFNESRLTLARKRRGLTGKELASRSGISAVHISRIERGAAEADSVDEATIKAFANALNYPYQFFFGDDVDIPTKDTASFRSLTAMSARERDAALSAGAIAYMVSDWVDANFNLPKVDVPSYTAEVTPEVAARMVRSYWNLGEKPIDNVIKLLESKGVRVFSLNEKNRNVDAFSCWRNDIPYIFLNTFKTAERSRFDALHELGHLVLHRFGTPQGRQVEQEANNFSSHFLMPEMDLASKIPFVTSLHQLVAAKKRWGVSVAALAYRLNKSGRLSDWQYRTFCIHINKRFGATEPDGLPRETSVVWSKIFKEMWKDGATRDDISKVLKIPNGEIDGLVFGLVDGSLTQRVAVKTKLSLV